MCWRADSRDVQSTYLVRKAMTVHLQHRVAERDRIGDAELVIGELLGNVARHSPGPYCTEIYWDAQRRPVVAVHDAGACFELAECDGEVYAESGRGLSIVQALVQGVEVHKTPPQGCVVMTTLDLHATELPPMAPTCPFLMRHTSPPACLRPVELRRQHQTQVFSTSDY